MKSTDGQRALTPDLPTYRLAREFVRIVDGVPRGVYREMFAEIEAQRGTPSDRVDWTDPDAWIPARITGDEQVLALRLWRESEGQLNPRYLVNCWLFSRTHELLQSDQDRVLRISDRGRAFLQSDPPTIAAIDRYEGMFVLLAIVADRGPAMRNKLYEPWAAFCRAETGYRSENAIVWALRQRLLNLRDRGLLDRTGNFYAITADGAAYLADFRSLLFDFGSLGGADAAR